MSMHELESYYDGLVPAPKWPLGAHNVRPENFPGEYAVRRIHDAYVAAVVRVAGEEEYALGASALREYDFPDINESFGVIHESAITLMRQLRPDLEPMVARMHNPKRLADRSPLVAAMTVVEKIRLNVVAKAEKLDQIVGVYLDDGQRPEDEYYRSAQHASLHAD